MPPRVAVKRRWVGHLENPFLRSPYFCLQAAAGCRNVAVSRETPAFGTLRAVGLAERPRMSRAPF